MLKMLNSVSSARERIAVVGRVFRVAGGAGVEPLAADAAIGIDRLRQLRAIGW